MRFIDRLNIEDNGTFYKCELQDHGGCDTCKFHDNENGLRLCRKMSNGGGASFEKHCISVMNTEKEEANKEYVRWCVVESPVKRIVKKKSPTQSQEEIDIINQLL